MAADAYEIRPFRDSDYEPAAAMWTQMQPGRIFTGDDLRRFTRLLAGTPLEETKWAVEERRTGATVAFADLGLNPDRFEVPAGMAGVGVVPEHQHQGLGRRLWELVLAEGRRRGFGAIWAQVLEGDERGVRFFTRAGFVEHRRKWRSRLLVAEANAPPDRSEQLARAGVRFTTLDAEGPEDLDVRRRLVDLGLTAALDIPRSGQLDPGQVRILIEREHEGPTILPEAYIIAVKDGRYVGSSYFERVEGDPSELHVGFTGTLREVRGLGIATELKRRGLEYAREHGIRSITTGNDSANAPMWAINEKMGYRRERVYIEGERKVADGSGQPTA